MIRGDYDRGASGWAGVALRARSSKARVSDAGGPIPANVAVGPLQRSSSTCANKAALVRNVARSLNRRASA